MAQDPKDPEEEDKELGEQYAEHDEDHLLILAAGLALIPIFFHRPRSSSS